MLGKEIQKELEEICGYGARIMNIAPYIATNSDGKPEQFYQVNMMDMDTTYYIDVDEYGAILGGAGCKYDVAVLK